MPVLLAIIAVLGLGTGTVMVADDAKPGNALFGIDRAVENIRLSLANDNRKNELRIAFAAERIEELEDLLDDEDEDEVEDEDEDENEDEEENENEEESEVESLDEETTANVEEGIGLALDLLSEIEDGDYSDLIERLNALLNEVPEGTELEVKISEKGASFLKIKSDDSGETKLEVEVKETGGEKIIIKTRSEDGRLRVEIRDEDGVINEKPDNSGPGSLNSGRDDDDDDDEEDDEDDEDLDDDNDEDDDDDEDDDETVE